MDKCSTAHEFARGAYGSEPEHSNEVRDLVERAGGDEDLQAAALLHDLVEDTDVGLDAIRAEFGPKIAGYVDAMTEDDSIDGYAERKEEHRLRARDAGRAVALMFVADKLSNARRMRRGVKEPDARKLGHYGATLQTMRAAYPDLPLLDELGHELDELRSELQRTTPA